MKQIIAIAKNTFKEAIRDRILFTFLGFAILLIIASKFISMLTIGDPVKVIKDVGLFAIQIFGMLISVMVSVMMISREFERKTIYTILSKQVTRLQYLLGKYLGMVLIVATMIALMAVALVVIVLLFGYQFEIMLLFGAFMTWLEMCVLCAFAVLFATVTKPILGTVLTLSAFVLGHLTSALWLLFKRVTDEISRFFIQLCYYVLPNLEVFNFKTEVVHGLAIPLTAVFWAIAYAIIYSSLLITVSWLQFSNKDIE